MVEKQNRQDKIWKEQQQKQRENKQETSMKQEKNLTRRDKERGGRYDGKMEEKEIHNGMRD